MISQQINGNISDGDSLPTDNSLLKAALDYARRGWSVIPLRPSSKTPLIDWKPYQQRQATEEEIRSWWSRWPSANVGFVTGTISGVIVLDIDGPEGEAEIEKRGGLPQTLISRTGKGRHAIFRHPGGTISNSVRELPGLDLRGDGGYIVAPPSIHPSGMRYEWEVRPDDVSFADPPAWLLTNGAS